MYKTILHLNTLNLNKNTAHKKILHKNNFTLNKKQYKYLN